MKDINMKRARKTWAILIVSCFALVISAMLLGGCSQSGQSQSTNVGNAPTATVTSQAEQVSFNYDASIEPTVLVDNKVAKIEANDISFEDDKINVDLSITNKSKKKFTCYGGAYGFSANFINNYMVDDGWFNTEVASGESEDVVMSIDSVNFMMYGINEINEIGIGIKIVEVDSYKTLLNDVYTVTTNCYTDAVEYTNTFNAQLPQIAQTMEGEIISATDNELFNQSDIVLGSPAIVKNNDGELALMIEIVNNGSRIVNVTFRDVKINGEVVSEYLYTNKFVAPAKQAIADFDLSTLAKKIDLDVSDPSSIKSIAFDLEVEDIKGNSVLPETGLEINF